jgi:phage terminase small subunit
MPNEEQLPAREEQGLTELQEAFAVAFASNGGNAKQAAIEAGYSEDSARTTGPRLAKHPNVLKRIAEECMTLMATSVPAALAAQRQLLSSSRSDMVKHLVATDMLDRTLGKAVQRVDQHTSAELTVRIDLS